MNSVSALLTVILVVVCTIKGIKTANECEFNIIPTSETVTLNSTAEFHCETPDNTGGNPFFLVNGQSVAQEGLEGVTLCNSTQARTIKITIQATPNYNNSNVSCLYQSGPSECCSDPVAVLTIIDSGAPMPTSTPGTTEFNFPSPTSTPQGTPVSPAGEGKGCDKACVAGSITGGLVGAALLTAIIVYGIYKYHTNHATQLYHTTT